jgi:cytochrome P450
LLVPFGGGALASETARVDLLHPSSRQDPYPAYEALRASEPVHRSERLGMWVLTRYDDVEQVVTDTKRFTVERFAPGNGGGRDRAVADVLHLWTVYRDPPDHTRLRGLLGRSFLPRRLDALRPRIQGVVDQLADDLARRGECDFIAEFAFPLPATVIAILLGVPLPDIPHVKAWSNQIADYIGGARSGDDAAHARAGLLEACAYFRDLARVRRRAPGEDVLTLLLAAGEQGERLSDEEVVANCVLLLFAGHETTTNLLGNGLHHLLAHPEQEALVRRRADLVGSLVEECLRFDAPVAGTLRIATEDVELRGRTIRCRDVVAAMLGAANRDPDRFARPDAFDLTRTPNRHLAFGYATHFCLGAGLARLEAQIAFATLLRRFRRLTALEALPRWKPQVFFRELAALPVAVEE